MAQVGLVNPPGVSSSITNNSAPFSSASSIAAVILESVTVPIAPSIVMTYTFGPSKLLPPGRVTSESTVLDVSLACTVLIVNETICAKKKKPNSANTTLCRSFIIQIWILERPKSMTIGHAGSHYNFKLRWAYFISPSSTVAKTPISLILFIGTLVISSERTTKSAG